MTNKQNLEQTIVQTNSMIDSVFDFYGYFYGENTDCIKIYPNVIENYLTNLKYKNPQSKLKNITVNKLLEKRFFPGNNQYTPRELIFTKTPNQHLLTAQDILTNNFELTTHIPIQQIFDNACNDHVNTVFNYLAGNPEFMFKSDEQYLTDENIPYLVRLAILHKDKLSFFPSIYQNGEILSDIDIDISEKQLQQGLEKLNFNI